VHDGGVGGNGIPRALGTFFLFRLDRRLDDADGVFSGRLAGPAGALVDISIFIPILFPSFGNGRLGPTHPGLDIVAGALPFLRRDVEDGVGAGTGVGWGCGDDGCATRCRLGLRADDGDSVAPWAGLVLLLRFRVLGTGVGVGGIGGGAVAESEAAAAVGLGMEDAAWLAA
jgi:hypothetical protein